MKCLYNRFLLVSVVVIACDANRSASQLMQDEKQHAMPVSADEGDTSSSDTAHYGEVVEQACDEDLGRQLEVGISEHFQDWLRGRASEAFDLARMDLLGGSFGGLVTHSDCVLRQPVIFVHGNSDRAIGGSLGGWQASTEWFTANGYRQAELYATSWGDADPDLIFEQHHSVRNIRQIRLFIEAVLSYTGAEKVDIIAHSMGVTLARKALKGGSASDEDALFWLGESLGGRVDTFVAIAGAHQGLASCYPMSAAVNCNDISGFFPGTFIGGQVVGESSFLQDINDESGYEGQFRYSIWSTIDEVIGFACQVWGQNTCLLPDHTAGFRFDTFPYDHLGLRDETVALQYNLVTSQQR